MKQLNQSNPYAFTLSYRKLAMLRKQTEPGEARTARITAHYAREVALGHMDASRAAERLATDLKGDNYFPARSEGPGQSEGSKVK